MTDLKEFMLTWVDDEIEALHKDRLNGFDVTERSMRSLQTLKKLLNLKDGFK